MDTSAAAGRLCLVAVHAPLGRRLFSYECPRELGECSPGDAVLVPFRGRELIGWIVQWDVTTDQESIKPILEKIDGAGLSGEDLKLCETLQTWYGTNFSDILSLFVPPEAPKLSRRIERIRPEAMDGQCSGSARHVAALVDENGGSLDIRKVEAASKHLTRAAFRSALQELASTGLFVLRTGLIHVRPGQKKFLGPPDEPAGGEGGVTEIQKKIIELATRHPYRFGASELAKLSHVGLKDVRTLIRNKLLVERTSRIWRTPMERTGQSSEPKRDDPASPASDDRQATPSQSRSISEMSRSILARTSDVYLLYGPTASGKTFVYEALARQTLAQGRQVLLMVPEIALTRPLIDRIRKSIPEPISVIHSRQTRAERRDEWQRTASGTARLLVGPRSAAFVPMPELGLAIIDECHDAGYKQSESPYLDARKVVEEKCKLKGASLILGSATPSIEQLYMTVSGAKIRRLDLTDFPTRIERPAVTVIDLAKVQRSTFSNSSTPQTIQAIQGLTPFLTPALQQMMEDTLGRKEAVILLLNRRGFSPLISCPSCGYTVQCQACLMAMVYHAQDRQVLCHGCGKAQAPPAACPGCRYAPLGYIGAGTERIEEDCRRRFPGARVGRLDQDVFRRSRKEAFGILDELKSGRLDILIGTQMIAKGLDIPRVTLAAVVFADIGLHMPDYRSRERTFQLLAQLIGRSGRHFAPGKAVLQTFQPDNPAIVCSVREDIQGFFEREIEERRMGLWPPFVRLVRILIQSKNAPKALQAARQIHSHMTAAVAADIAVSPPLPAPRPKWNGEYRFQMLMRMPPHIGVPAALIEELKSQSRPSEVKLSIEPDPISIL